MPAWLQKAFAVPRWAGRGVQGLLLGALLFAGAPLRVSASDNEGPLAPLEQLAIHQPAQAQRELDAFVSSATELSEHGRLHAELIRALIADSQYRSDDVLAIAARIQERLRVLGDPRMQMLLEHARAGALYELGRIQECVAALDEEWKYAQRTNDDDILAQADIDRARMLLRTSAFESAAAVIADAQRLARGPQASAEVAFSNALLAKAVGDWTLALQSYQLAFEKFQAVGDRTGEADSLAGMGEALRQLGRYAEALQPLDDAINAYREVEDRDGEAIAMLRKAMVYAGLKDGARALATHARALTALAKLNEPLQLAQARIELARVLLESRRVDDASTLIEQARPMILALGNLHEQAQVHQLAAAILAARGKYHGAYDEMAQYEIAESTWTEQLVTHQLAVQRGRLQSERLSRENVLLRSQAQSNAEALASAQRASNMEILGLFLGTLIVVGSLLAIWRQRGLLRRIARLAETDSLTGVLNRRHVQELGQRMMNRCRREGRPCAILMLDIDRFKEINDRYGHTAGDRALCAISGALTRCLRPGDHLGRYGGEEFAVILPGADAREAGVVAERLRQAVAQLAPDWAPGAEALTVSGGIAIATNAIEDFTQLIDQADRALYRAKNAGRNRMEYDPAGSELVPG